jgi:hypothetical protein
MELEHFQKQQQQQQKQVEETNINKHENEEEKKQQQQQQQRDAWLEEKVTNIFWKEQLPKLQRHMETKLQHSMMERNKILLAKLEKQVTAQMQTEFRNTMQSTIGPQQTQWSDQLVELWDIVQHNHTFTQSLQEQVQTISQCMQQQQRNQHRQDEEWNRNFRELSKAVRQHAADQLEQRTKIQTFVEEFHTQKQAIQTDQEKMQQHHRQFCQMLETLQSDIVKWKQTMEQSMQHESERMLHFQTGLVSTTDQSIQNLQSQIDRAILLIQQQEQEKAHRAQNDASNAHSADGGELYIYRQRVDALQSTKVDKEDWQVLQNKMDEVMKQVQALQSQKESPQCLPPWMSSRLLHSQSDDPSSKCEKDEEEEKKEDDGRDCTEQQCIHPSEGEQPKLLQDHSVLLLWQELREQMRQLKSWMERMDADQKMKDQLWHTQWEQCRVVEHTLQHQLRESQWENRGLYRTLKKLQQQSQQQQQEKEEPRSEQEQLESESKQPLRPT